MKYSGNSPDGHSRKRTLSSTYGHLLHKKPVFLNSATNSEFLDSGQKGLLFSLSEGACPLTRASTVRQ